MAYQTPQLVLIGSATGLVLGFTGIPRYLDSVPQPPRILGVSRQTKDL